MTEIELLTPAAAAAQGLFWGRNLNLKCGERNHFDKLDVLQAPERCTHTSASESAVAATSHKNFSYFCLERMLLLLAEGIQELKEAFGLARQGNRALLPSGFLYKSWMFVSQ